MSCRFLESTVFVVAHLCPPCIWMFTVVKCIVCLFRLVYSLVVTWCACHSRRTASCTNVNLYCCIIASPKWPIMWDVSSGTLNHTQSIILYHYFELYLVETQAYLGGALGADAPQGDIKVIQFWGEEAEFGTGRHKNILIPFWEGLNLGLYRHHAMTSYSNMHNHI